MLENTNTGSDVVFHDTWYSNVYKFPSWNLMSQPSASDTGLRGRHFPSSPNRSRTFDLPVTGLDPLPLSYNVLNILLTFDIAVVCFKNTLDLKRKIGKQRLWFKYSRLRAQDIFVRALVSMRGAMIINTRQLRQKWLNASNTNWRSLTYTERFAVWMK